MAITRPFAYTNRDYDSLLADLKRRMQAAIPDWTSFDTGFESILLETYAYVGDILNFYVDRMGNEAFLRTAVLRESVLNIAQMMGYIPSPQTAATCTVQFTKAAGINEDVVIPAGTQLFAQAEGLPPVYFETASSLTIIAANASGTVTAVEGRTETLEVVGSSNGSESQAFVMHYPNVIKDSVRVYTRDGVIDPATGLPSYVEWTYFARLIDSQFYDRAFSLYVDEDNYAYVLFGDGVSGLIPPSNLDVYVTYRHGVGSDGNVGVGAIRSFVDGGTLATKIGSVTNTTAATGGSDPETIESMRTSIPRSLTTIERAVTTSDYASLALQVPGVAKASAASTVSTSVTLYVAPTGGGAPSTPLKNSVAAYFDGPPSRKMIGTTVTVSDPTYVNVNMTLSVTVNARYRQDSVVKSVKAAIANLYDFSQRSFGELLMKATVFRELVDIPGVDYVDITVFSKTGSGTADIQLLTNEIGQPGTITVNATGGVVL